MSILNLAPLFFETVATSSVVEDHAWGDPVDQLTGTNADLEPTTDASVPDTSPARLWNFTQPALPAVDPSATVPGYGPGEAVPVTDLEFECSDIVHSVCANTGETKTHCFTPVDEDGNPIDLMGASLVFVVERGDRVDTETGSATQAPDTLKVSFTATQAHEREGTFPFAVRMVSGNRLVGKGEIVVSYAPSIGSPESSPEVEDSFCFTVTHQITEVPLEGALVTVTQAGEIVSTAKTDANGDVSVPLPAGMYVAEFFFEDYKFEPYPFEVE